MSEKIRPRHKEAGWCLALHHFTGEGIEAERAEPLPKEMHGKPWLYCADELLGTEEWPEIVRQWQESVETLALWVSDCRFTDKPGARIDRDRLAAILFRDGWACLEDDIIEGRAFIVVRKTGQKFDYRPWEKAAKHCLVIRGGAYGDALMAASVLPALKAEGWTIDFACNEFGADVLKNDPHIDNFLVARRGMVNDHILGPYWAAMGARYDRVVNLSYTLEHTLLKRPWDGAYFWPHEQRKRLLGGSYLANNHEIAGVPGPYRVKFYPTEQESEAAAKAAATVGPFILWALRGSAVHKWYPYGPQVAIRLLAETKLSIVLTGDDKSADLESKILDGVIEFLGPDAAKRIHSMVGTGPIRRVLAMAQHAAVVIGPETGVLNAVGQEAVPKVCLLSHSAPSNLTDDWTNAVAVTPDVPCWPCHRLHYGHDHCPQDPRTTAAACQASVEPARIVAAVHQALALHDGGMLVPSEIAPAVARVASGETPIIKGPALDLSHVFARPNGHIPEVPAQ